MPLSNEVLQWLIRACGGKVSGHGDVFSTDFSVALMLPPSFSAVWNPSKIQDSSRIHWGMVHRPIRQP